MINQIIVPTTYGQRLRASRHRAMLTTRELSRLTGVTQATIVRLENDQQPARISTTRALAAALNITPQALAGMEENSAT
jgi:transcriptional regulator with XRE-family HTH domain